MDVRNDHIFEQGITFAQTKTRNAKNGPNFQQTCVYTYAERIYILQCFPVQNQNAVYVSRYECKKIDHYMFTDDVCCKPIC